MERKPDVPHVQEHDVRLLHPDCEAGQNRGIPYRPRLDDAGAGFEDGSTDVARHPK